MTARLSLAILLIFTPALVAQSAFHAGVRFPGIADGAHPAALAVDAQGNTFIVSYVVDGFGDQRIRIDKNDANGNSIGSFQVEDPDAYTVVAAAVDASGNLVVAGNTSNPAALYAPVDAYVTRIDSQLKTTLSSIKLGGTQDAGVTLPGAMALDQKGNIYLTGWTDDATFPVTAGAFQTSPPAEASSYAFLTEFAPDGKSILYSTFFGDASVACAATAEPCPSVAFTAGTAIAVDGSANVAIAGYTMANHLPVTAAAFSPTCGDCGITSDGSEALAGFVAKFSAGGATLLASTYIPVTASSPECTLIQPTALLFDSSGNIVAAGVSSSVLPVTTGAVQAALPAPASDGNGFVLKLDGATQHLLFSTYFGGFGVAESFPSVYQLVPGAVTGMVEDAQGLIWLTGGSPSGELPTPSGTRTFGDAYLAGISPDGSSLEAVFTAPLGVAGTAIAVTPSGITALGSSGGLLTASPGAGPSLVAVENAAGSIVSGSVAPSELICLYGPGIGSGSTEVLFDGLVAPVLYSAPTQINAIVPAEVAGRAATALQIVASSGAAIGVTMQVSPSQPGVVLSQGQPQDSGIPYAAALNQDGTVNSAANPAAFGSLVSVWVSGAGLSTIPVRDGTIRTSKDLGAPILPVAAFATPIAFSGLIALGTPAGPLSTEVVFAGDAPGMVSGVTQINFLVPSAIQIGYSPGTFLLGGYEFWIQIGDSSSEHFTLYLK